MITQSSIYRMAIRDAIEMIEGAVSKGLSYEQAVGAFKEAAIKSFGEING